MATTTALWMVLCLAGPAAAVTTSDPAPAPCYGRGSVRGHAENQTRCYVDGRLYRHAPAAQLAGWRQLVTLGTVHQMRSRLHHLARHKRSAPEDPGSAVQGGGQQPCCPSQTSVMIPLSAVSSDSGMRVPLAQAPPSHVQPVLVVSCDGDRCPHTNSTCKQMYAPQMLVRLSGRRLILDLVNIESGCQCVPPPLPQLPTDDVATTRSDDVTKPPGASARLPGVTTGSPTAGPGTVAQTGAETGIEEQMTTPEMRTTPGRTATEAPTAEAPTTAATTEPATMMTEGVTTEAPTTEPQTTEAATMTTMAVTMKARTTGVHSDRTERPNNRPTLMPDSQVRNASSTAPPVTSTTTAGTTMAETTTAETTTVGTTKGEITTAGTTKGETTTAGTAKGETSTAGTSKGETTTAGTAKGETTTAGTTKGETSTAGTTKGETTTVATTKGETTTAAATTKGETTTAAGTMKGETTTAGTTKGETTTAGTTKGEITTAGTTKGETTTAGTTKGETTIAGTTKGETTTTGTTKGETTTAATTKGETTTAATTKRETTTAATTKGETTTTMKAETTTAGTMKGETTTAGTTKRETTTAGTTKGETTTAATTKGFTTTAATTKGVTTTAGTTMVDATTAATTKGETTTVGATKGITATAGTTKGDTTTVRTTMADTTTAGATTAGTTKGETMTARSMTVGTTPGTTTPPAGTSAPVGPRVTPTPTQRGRVTVTVSTACPEAGATAGENRGHGGDRPPVVLAMMAGEKARPDGDGGPMRGDMQPREEGAPWGPPPPPGRAPLVSSGGHQTHNLSESLLHLASLSGALPAQWPPLPVHLTEDHIRLAGLLAASYSLGRAACEGATPAPPPPQALPAWVMPAPPPPPMRPPMSAWAPGMPQAPITAPPTAEDASEDEDESESSEDGREDGLLEDELIEDEVTEDPLMEEEEGSGGGSDVDAGEVEAVIAARSALLVPRVPRRRGGRTVGRTPTFTRRSESMVMPRMSDLSSDRPLARSAASRSSAVAHPAPVDRLTAMKLVEDIMERHRSALGELYSEQRQQLDEQLKQQRQAIQRTFSVELKYVADILTAIGTKPHDKPVQTPPGHEEEEGDDDYQDDADSQETGQDKDGEEAGVNYPDTDAEQTDESTNPPTVQAPESPARGEDDTAPGAVRPTRYPESLPANWTVAPGPAGAGAESGTTPFARSPRTNYSDAVCSPFSEEAATTALMRDARVLMDALFGIGLELFQAVRPDEPAAARISLPVPRSASPRASQQMTRLVRAVAGSEVRFQYPLDTLRDLEAPLDRLQELLSAGVDSRPVPGGADYNLTSAVTALTTCFIDSVPGFRLEMNSEGRTALGELKRDAPRLQDRSTADGSVALRLSAALEHAWSLYRFMFNAFIGPASRVQLEADRNLRVISLRREDLRAALAGAAAGLPGARRSELRRILTQLTADGSELQHAVSELRQLMTLMSDVSDLLLTSRPTGGSPRAIESGPSAVIRHVGDALLRGLGCMFSALDGSWLPPPLPDSPSLPAAPTDSEPPAVCESTEDTEQAILDDMPIFVEMLYKIGLKFTGAFTVEAASRQAAAVPRLDTAVSPASLQMERLVRVVAGSTGRFRHPLASAEEYISLLDRLTALLAAGAERANSTPPAAPGGEGQDHNLTEAVELMIACFVEHVPGFELQRDSAARAALTAVGELETVIMQGRSTQLVPRGPSVAMRLSVVMVRTWTNWVTLLNRFLRPAASVQLHQSTSVRVLSVRARELRAALLAAVRALEPRRQQELREVCTALAAADPRLQPAVGELRHLMDYLADITDLLLTTGAAGPRQAIAAGPSAVIRHMGYALLHSLGCFSAALAWGGDTPVQVHPWATPSPPTTPAPPPPPPPAGDVPTPRCQVLEDANSDAVIVRDLEVLMKDFFDMGLTFFNLFKSDPVFAPTLFGAEGAGGSLLPDARTSSAAAASAAEASARQGWLMGAVRGGAMRYQFPLEVLEQQLPALERLWTLIAAGAGGSPLGPADSEHNLTQAVTALTGCFVQHVPGYHLEEILDAKSTDPTAVGLPHLDPVKRRAGDSDSVTLRAADVTATTWRVWRPVLGAFVRPSSVVQLQPAKNVRVLSLNVDRLRARLMASISALDVVQRAELSRVCRQLGSAKLRFAVGELQQLLAPLAELAALRLTKAAPLARQQQQTAAAGPAGIVVQMSRALPHSLGCFLAALAGDGDGDGGVGVPPEIPPPVTAAPGAIPIPIPSAQPIPSVPQPGAQPVPVFTAKPKPSASPKPPSSAIPKPPSTVAASEPTAAPATRPPPQQTTTTAAAAAGDETESPEHGDEAGHGDLFLTQQDVDVVDDILAGLG